MIPLMAVGSWMTLRNNTKNEKGKTIVAMHAGQDNNKNRNRNANVMMIMLIEIPKELQ